MQIDFTGKTVLVTGGSRGIGRQIAADLRDSGATLVVTSTREADAERMVEEFGPATRHIAVDLARRESRDAFLETLASLDELHACVNNAGVARHGRFDAVSETDWDVTNDVNLKAPFLIARAVAPLMRRQGYGRIVNVTSIWAHMTMEERTIYTATKFGLRGMTETLAVELARDNVLVNTVAPGFTLTDMARRSYDDAKLAELAARIPMGRLAEVEDISGAVLFLASDLNTYINGQSLVVDGGYSVC
jgi:3-oxoacyl-[acyl-carrier protein] reductase